jgi:hypothetical protein
LAQHRIADLEAKYRVCISWHCACPAYALEPASLGLLALQTFSQLLNLKTRTTRPWSTKTCYIRFTQYCKSPFQAINNLRSHRGPDSDPTRGASLIVGSSSNYNQAAKQPWLFYLYQPVLVHSTNFSDCRSCAVCTVPAGLCFNLNLWCGPITLVARSRPAVLFRSNYRRNL